VTQPEALRQLDFFLDGRDALLVHAVVRGLVARDQRDTERRLVELRAEHPAHPDAPALARLAGALGMSPPSLVDHETVTDAAQPLHDVLAPAARRLLGEADGPAFLRPLWLMLAEASASLRFDERYPRAHRSWLCQHVDDWLAVQAAVEDEPHWPGQPLLRYRLGLARHHLGDADGALRLWLPLCWLDGALFARYTPGGPDPALREAWDAFDRAGAFGDPTESVRWFPSWLLVRHRRLADVFQPGDAPDEGPPTEAFRALLMLIPLERHGLTSDVIAARRDLQRLSPELFAAYMESRGGRRPA
jgi:hypothetical protein